MGKMDISEVIRTSLDAFNITKCAPGAFTGAANARGNHNGTNDPTTLFKVTGTVLVRIFGVCSVDLAGATATIEVGVAGNTAALLAQTTGTDIDVGDIWADTTPTLGAMVLADVLGPYIVTKDIIETIGTADLTGGNIQYICLWRPLSPDGNVEAAI